MDNNKNIFAFISLICVVVLGITVLFLLRDKTAYIDINQIYDNFTLKKELEVQLQTVKKERAAILDTMELNLKVLSKEIDIEKGSNRQKLNTFSVKREIYLEKKQEFEETTIALLDDYKAKIWKQLKQYVKEYGDKKGYDYIYGVDDEYNFIYVNQSNNITKDVESFVNERYSGVKK